MVIIRIPAKLGKENIPAISLVAGSSSKPTVKQTASSPTPPPTQNPKKPSESQPSKKINVKVASKLRKALWSTVDDVTLVQILTEQQAMGNQADNSWKSFVWVASAVALKGSENLSGGGPKTADGCENHWGTKVYVSCYYCAITHLKNFQLKKDFQIVNKL